MKISFSGFLNLILIMVSGQIAAQAYDSKNIEFKSNWKDLSLDYSGLETHYNSIWGYHDKEKNREYAILGGKNGTYFIEVTNPYNPVLRAFVKGRQQNCIWREYKSYKNYAYLISDDAPPNSLQIVDMKYLPDSVKVVYDSDELFETSHTLYIEGENLFCASVFKKDKTYFPMAVYSLKNPEKPEFLRSLDQDYPEIGTVHDMFVRNDTVYASCAFQGLFIFKFTDNRFQLLGSITNYLQAGYNHSSWLTPDGKTLAFCDEVPEGLPVTIADVSDFSEIKIKSNFFSTPGATAHNPYIVGDNNLVIAYYQDGVQIYDISNPAFPERIAYFDTHPQNGNTYNPSEAYNGCWGAYPFLPSGTLIASDRQNGLFVLNAGLMAGVNRMEGPEIKVFPNPFKDEFTISLLDTLGDVEINCFDIAGRKVFTKKLTLPRNHSYKINLGAEITPGIYFIHVQGEGIVLTEKLIKQ